MLLCSVRPRRAKRTVCTGSRRFSECGDGSGCRATKRTAACRQRHSEERADYVAFGGVFTFWMNRGARCASRPIRDLLPARSELLVALSKKLDQPVHTALVDLIAELLPICLDEPDAKYAQVI